MRFSWKFYKNTSYSIFFKILKKKRSRYKNYSYYRFLTISLLFKKKYFFIHQGYIFSYRFFKNLHLGKKFGSLSVTRKLITKAVKKNKKKY